MGRFIMLAGPAMIGKSTLASDIARDDSYNVAVLNGDALMHDMFRLAGLPDCTSISISDTGNWLRLLRETGKWHESDIGHLHAERVGQHPSSTIVADSYLYMLSWYRAHVYQGLSKMHLDFWLIRFEPPVEVQVARRKQAYRDRHNWKDPDSLHEAELRKAWELFDVPMSAEQVVRYAAVGSCAELAALLAVGRIEQ